jgi:hypothetical protein
LNWCGKLALKLVNGGQPETVFVGIEMARAPTAITLNERCGSKVFKTAARAGQRLATTTGTGTSMLKNKLL